MKNLLTLLKDNAKLNVAAGITLAILGILCINLPFLSGLAVASIVSLATIAFGITTSIFSFSKEKLLQKILSFISGTLITLFGAFMLTSPVANLYILAVIAVLYFIIDGVMNLVTTYQMRKTKIWGWSLFNGLISLLLAGLLIAQWPLSSFYIIGTLIGVRFMFTGFNIVLLASTGFGFVDALENKQSKESNMIENTKVGNVQTV